MLIRLHIKSLVSLAQVLPIPNPPILNGDHNEQQQRMIGCEKMSMYDTEEKIGNYWSENNKKKLKFNNKSTIIVADNPNTPLRGKSPLTSFYEKLPKCPHGHDKAWNAECPLCTPDDDCCKRDGDDYDCPLKFESYFDSAGNKILICSPDCCNRETVCEPHAFYRPGEICCVELKKDKGERDDRDIQI